MKDKNLPNDYNSLSLEELTTEANKMIEELENQKDLGNSLDKYQDLIKLNNIIEKKFQKNTKEINEKTKERISHFFEHYKDLEKDKWVKLIGWGNKEEAIEIIHDSIKSFKS